MTGRQRLAIAGAGIGGLTAALCLARAGFSVDVFERADALEEVGAGIQLSPNASRILIELGLEALLAPAVVAPAGMDVRSGPSGSLIVAAELGEAWRVAMAPPGGWSTALICWRRSRPRRRPIQPFASRPGQWCKG